MEGVEFKVYPWRFLVLISFSSFTFCQSWIWLGFGAFSDQTKAFFGWKSDAWVSWYLFLGPCLFLVGTPLFLWMLDKKGIRMTCVVGSLMNLVGVALKLPCLWMENRVAGWALVMIGQSLTSIAGVAAMAVPAKISSVWFAPNERSVSTSVAVVANSTGTACAFLLGLAYTAPASTPYETLFFQILVQVSFAAASTISILLFVFDAPATASSKATDRDVTNINVLSELLKLAKNGPFLFLIFAAGATQGIFTSWSGMLGLILAELPETAQSFLGFGSNIAGVVGGLVFGAISVFLQRKYKLMIVLCFLVSGASFLFFTLQVANVIPFALPSVAVLCLCGSFFIAAANPLFYELGVELAYPAPEGVVGTIVALSVNFLGIPLYPLQPYIPRLAINLINALIPFLFALLLSLFMNERYRRNDLETIDTETKPLKDSLIQ